jgi:hypothetical protein
VFPAAGSRWRKAADAARLSTTLQDQNAPRRKVELANWLARL